MKVHIFTMATGAYNWFIQKFIETISNFLPEYKKIIHVFTNEKFDFELDEDDNIEDIIINYLPDMPFYVSCQTKIYQPYKSITDEMEYVFFFDIDTIFLEKDNEYWKWFIDEVNDGILISRHPHYYDRENWVEEYCMERNKDSSAYIPFDEKLSSYTISSFWGGKKDDVVRMCEEVDKLVSSDLMNLRYVPRFIEENYINKVIWLCEKKYIENLKFNNENFLMMTDNHEINNKDDEKYVFILQKYNNEVKKSKKIGYAI